MEDKEIITREMLRVFLQNQDESIPKDGEPHGLRYAIYLRKSTDDPEKQVRSVEDQESECLKVAEDNGITVLEEDIIREHESAKVSGMRPLFRKLLDRLIAGELDGIIAWHPNRLARNMLEAGEIIDLLDRNTIKDLKFAAHTFANDSSGKMLLGMVFVLAKQYSDQLSTDVMRGNRKSIESGAYINKSKHGYVKDTDQRLRPDGNNYALMKEAFRKRLQGETLETIAQYLNESSYTRRNREDSDPYKTKFTKQVLSSVFGDPVYAGVVHYGKSYKELEEVYDFMPMITPEEFFLLNNYDPYAQKVKLKRVKRSKGNLKADLLSGQVLCHYCKSSMHGGATRSSAGKRYYYFRCGKKECEMFNKSTRAKVIVDFAKNYLAQKPFTSKESYESYRQEIMRLQQSESGKIQSQIMAAKQNLNNVYDDIESVESNMAKETDAEMKGIQREQRKKLKDREKHLRKVIKELDAKKKNILKAPATFEKFIAIIDDLSDTLDRVQSTEELDGLLSKIFLNLYVTQKSVEKYTLKAPFGALECLNRDEVSLGGRCRT